ncbi:alpha-L-fucosidase [Pontibacter diazotrophicus]|uniref:alpha-L-fucosidase n=1 Tax=Pontibacter diazotrophicus TaxID=1400979 RepID=A0A3D8LD77_9BACT|nr:alpha-L-fucosidase [Pontibacter diazotrophicus]RDV15303.1 alpha-L-fucosidase [Pontibacter diazotrophicus]
MKKHTLFTLIAAIVASTPIVAQELPKPEPRQLEWQQLETTAFLHFTVNTFTGKEWGDGTESPQIFNPKDFDARKIVKTLKDTGFKMAIITAKHHDGFCLWPSKYTDHTVASSPWKNGKGDVVKEIADACQEYGIKFGFYLSPWDQHEEQYGTPSYNAFYKNQLRELLTNYGEVSEVWFDGAKGDNAKNMEYDFDGYWQLVRELQPKAVMFSDVGPDVRWVGNESGNAGETCWSTIDTVGMAPGKADPKYLNVGDPEGSLWIPAETDVSIRPGWFYHPEEDSKVKSGKQLVDLYYKSVGRNSLLLLNIPPNPKGLFAEQDVRSLHDFRSILDETFRENLAVGRVTKQLTDQKLTTYITLKEKQPLVWDFQKEIAFDRAMFQENIAEGQRNVTALMEYWDGKAWQQVDQFTTIGYKRLLRFPQIKTSRVRITVLEAKQPVQLAEVGFYKASPRE